MKGYKFDNKKHVHSYDGKPLIGVTRVMGIISKGDGLLQWAVNETIKFIKSALENDEVQSFIAVWKGAATAWKNTRDEAATAGTDVHAIIEELVKDAIKFHDGRILSGESPHPQVQHFLDWAITNKVRFLESEKHVYSLEMWIGGICDLVFEIDGKIYIGDIKTSKQIYPTYYWQMSAYQACLQEMGLYPNVDGFKVIRLGKDGTFEVGENYAYIDNIDGFKSALNVYRKLNLIT